MSRYDAQIDDAIRKAEERAAQTSDECGDAGSLRKLKGYFYCTRCDHHARQLGWGSNE